MLAPGAVRWIGPFGAVVVLLVALVGLRVLPAGPVEIGAVVALLAATTFLAWFFRDPSRPVGAGIVSAADGRIREVEDDGTRLRISVFMNVTDVHVNRVPLDGTLQKIVPAGAGFRAAYRPAAEQNVRRHYHLETALGPVEVVQITGVVARRIVSFVAAGATLHRGDRFGMIVLGSRVDLILPSARVRASVRVGDRVRAGVSTVAEERA